MISRALRMALGPAPFTVEGLVELVEHYTSRFCLSRDRFIFGSAYFLRTWNTFHNSGGCRDSARISSRKALTSSRTAASCLAPHFGIVIVGVADKAARIALVSAPPCPWISRQDFCSFPRRSSDVHAFEPSGKTFCRRTRSAVVSRQVPKRLVSQSPSWYGGPPPHPRAAAKLAPQC